MLREDDDSGDVPPPNRGFTPAVTVTDGGYFSAALGDSEPGVDPLVRRTCCPTIYAAGGHAHPVLTILQQHSLSLCFFPLQGRFFAGWVVIFLYSATEKIKMLPKKKTHTSPELRPNHLHAKYARRLAVHTVG